jgi:hypothetical protein
MKTQQHYKRPIASEDLRLGEGLHIETGGSILVSPVASKISDTQQPTNSKIVFVFSIVLLLSSAIAGFLGYSISQKKVEKAELSALIAKSELAKKQEQIDIWCRANSSISK